MKKNKLLLCICCLSLIFSAISARAGYEITLEQSSLNFLTPDDFEKGLKISGTNGG